ESGHVHAAEVRLDAELLRLANGVGHLRGVQQRLGRDTAPVQAGTSDLVLLHQPDRQVQLGRAQRGSVPARTTAKDNYVELVAHCLLPCRINTASVILSPPRLRDDAEVPEGDVPSVCAETPCPT